ARAALRRSIERRGILQPLHVRRINDSAHKYQIVDGHCRWEVAVELRIHVPSYLHESMTIEEAKVMAQELNFVGAALSHIRVAQLFSANAKFIGFPQTAELTSWEAHVVESYVAMADYKWDHDALSAKVEAARQLNPFAPDEDDEDDTGEWYWGK